MFKWHGQPEYRFWAPASEQMLDQPPATWTSQPVEAEAMVRGRSRMDSVFNPLVKLPSFRHSSTRSAQQLCATFGQYPGLGMTWWLESARSACCQLCVLHKDVYDGKGKDEYERETVDWN